MTTEYTVNKINHEISNLNLSLSTNSKAILKTDLNNLISDMAKISYGEDTNIMLYTDESIDKPGYIYGFYDGDYIPCSINGTWNKEHVWACSQMKINWKDPRPDSDTKNHATYLHNLRTTCQSSKGYHGNKFYDETNTEITFFPNISGTPNAAHLYLGDFRGDVDRILFYMATRYDFLSLNDDLDVAQDTTMGKLFVLLKWNEEDPVDKFEIQRNNRIYEYQDNRNPYIDHPEKASKIFG